MFKSIFLFSLVFFFSVSISRSQSLPVGTISNLEDYYRRQQLLGNLDSTVSMTVRPTNPSKFSLIHKPFNPDREEIGYNRLDPTTSWRYKNVFAGELLPLIIQTQFNTNHPYGWNDGSMIPAKGLETYFSTGLYAKYGPLSIQFQPEFIIAANTDFDTFDKGHYDVIVARYYDYYNNIDLPAKFGTDMYLKAYWGQSNIKLNYKSFSFGLSTENLWWGPGIRNSLVMSNTAPGFAHLTLNTNKPFVTPIGSFEAQLIAGRLENSGFEPLSPSRNYFNNPLYAPRNNAWRYLSGMVLTWQPKWITGLFLGATQTKQLYNTNLSGLGSYLPFFSTVKKVTADPAINKESKLGSLFMRWVWLPEHAEMYFEFAKDNNTNDLRNELLQPEDSRAYTFGLRKIMSLTSANGNVMVSIEATQIQETSLVKVADAESFYVNKYIRQGYTNNGQELGAGIGPGGNLQSLDVSWIKGLKRIGIQLERYLHNNDFYYYAFSDSKDFRRHWVDLSVAASGEWNYKNLIFNAKLMGIKSINYQWFLLQNPGELYFVNGKDAYNVQIQAGCTYRF